MKTKKGFTLVELLVVIAILAILATATIVGFTAFTQKAKQSNLEGEMKQVTELLQLEDYYNDHFSINKDGISFVLSPNDEEKDDLVEALQASADPDTELAKYTGSTPRLSYNSSTKKVALLSADGEFVAYWDVVNNTITSEKKPTA